MRISIVIAFLACAVLHAEEPLPVFQLPEGFKTERVAGVPLIKYPMFAAFDDRGRLYVAESSGLDLYVELQKQTRKCRVSRLEDADGDGVFERATVFADQLVFPMGLVWRGGKLYVADPPNLVAFEDTDDDGKADKQTTILSGFGHTDNGSLHGLNFGPDGRLYMTMGEPDGYKIKKGGKELSGVSGALIRCREDGSEPEVLCRGFENLVEVVFTPRGDVFGTDNWWQEPRDGFRDSLVHLIDGGHYPYAIDRGTPHVLTVGWLTPMNRVPAVAYSGLEYYRGTAFPAEMRGTLFSAQFNTRKVQRHILEARSATFVTRDLEFLSSANPDFHPADVLEDADGSLLVVDTGAWYVQHCPTGKIGATNKPGGIYRVRYSQAERPSDPRGLKEDWTGAADSRLIELLADARPAVANRAVEALVQRGAAAAPALTRALADNKAVPVRQHILWALSRISTPQARNAVRSALQDADPEILVTAINAAASTGDAEAATDLNRLLKHEQIHVRLAAALALSRCKNGDSAKALSGALSALSVRDLFLEHALIRALHGCAAQTELQAMLKEQNPHVRRAALILLDQAPHAGAPRENVIENLDAEDAALKTAALETLKRHPEWSEEAVRLLETLLAKHQLSENESQQAISLALAFMNKDSVRNSIGRAMRVEQDTTIRALVLSIAEKSNLKKWPPAWIDGLRLALAENNEALRMQAARVAAMKQVAEVIPDLEALALNAQHSSALRLAAAQSLAAMKPALPAGLIDFLIENLGKETPPATRLAAAETLCRMPLSPAHAVRVAQALRGQALISPTLVYPALRLGVNAESAGAIAEYMLESIAGGWQPPEDEIKEFVALLPEALRDKGAALLKAHAEGREGARATLERFANVLKGGNAEKGKAVFFGKKTACSTCHAAGGEGGQIGPDLTRIGAIRSGRDLLESIVIPSATFAQGFDNFLIVMDDGRRFTGVTSGKDTEVLTVKDSSGAQVRLRRENIKNIKRLNVSLMPDGLPTQMSETEFQDLIAFLLSLK